MTIRLITMCSAQKALLIAAKSHTALESIYEFCAVFVGHSSDPLLLLVHRNEGEVAFFSDSHGRDINI